MCASVKAEHTASVFRVMMEAIHSSETLETIYHISWSHNPEGGGQMFFQKVGTEIPDETVSSP
jgi:hypothetical protein